MLLALQLDLSESDINAIRSDNPNDTTQQALVMLRHWLQKAGSKATGLHFKLSNSMFFLILFF